MLSRRMTRLAGRLMRWLGDGKEFEGQDLLQAAWEWREFATDMRLMELAACTRDELFEPPLFPGGKGRPRTDTISAELARLAETLHFQWETSGKIPARGMMKLTGDLLWEADRVIDFETRRCPFPEVTPDIPPALPANVVKLKPGKPGAKRGGK
ncbi:MAG: hypothetical protein ABL951_15765 [Alphaproteobacteria bacterium]